MVPESPGVDRRRNKAVAQRMHGHKRGHFRDIAVVVHERGLGQGRARCRLNGDDLDVRAVDLIVNKRE